ncbi:MAG TPA: formate--tetrahydrofolate ligase [Microscillaceae bacterium]|nr:formate--tetrahydrofolate ligase [Microscillaceae bacterium]
MKSDIEISRETPLKPIYQIAQAMQIPDEAVEPYGKYKAKIRFELPENQSNKAKLILVTAITPTKAGIGKTTTSVGLALGLNKIGKKAVVALREPSLGPCFGMKGGAAGGGYAQVLPMEDINLHFTGDFHAITTTHNMLAALVDNYQFHHQGTAQQLKQVVWKRVLDLNDRSLRQVVTGLGAGNGVVAESGFDITPASEMMAVLCLSQNLTDLRQRLERIIVGYTADQKPFTVKDLGVAGALTVLLKDAIHPNLVQTTENTPAFIHGGPFANIAHGCNSVLATKMAMQFGDYVVTEAGFGADLGAEKFFNIKCRTAGLQPQATVLVITSQALKLHGQVPEADIKKPDLEGLKRGLANVAKHLANLQSFGQTVVLAFNQYAFDTAEEIDYVKTWAAERNAYFEVNNSFAEGGSGAVALAETVVQCIETNPAKPLQFTYALTDSLPEKIEKVARQIYGAAGITLSKKAQQRWQHIQAMGYEQLPICIAKTQYSFSDDPTQLGVAQGFTLAIEDLIINAGAGFVVVIAGDIMRMPGLPKVPQAQVIDLVNGQIEGLS